MNKLSPGSYLATDERDVKMICCATSFETSSAGKFTCINSKLLSEGLTEELNIDWICNIMQL